tara:strand:+ start:1315 stop:2262 length:948 start_codon:yes stop_codon:yes gene_type:complete
MEFVYTSDWGGDGNFFHGQEGTQELAKHEMRNRPDKYTNVYGISQVLPFLKHIQKVTLLDSTVVDTLMDDEIEVGVFLWMGHWKEEYDSLVRKFKKLFVIGDLNTCGQNTQTFEIFSKYKDKFTVLAFTPMQVEWIERVTKCKSFLYPPVFLDSNDFIYPGEDRDRDMLLFGGYHQRGGIWSHSFVNAHYDISEFDIMRRSDSSDCEAIHTIGYEKPIMQKLDYAEWTSLLTNYKYMIDGSEIFHQGRLGMDGLLTGTCYVGMKGMSYASYLFEEVSFGMDLGVRPTDDILDVFSNAISKVVTLEQVEDSVGEYL